jgi:tetratricopeptide (TPR) repeat protein
MYYRQLLDVLPHTDMEPGRKDLWAGIAQGNMGHVLALQHQFSAAMPLLQAYVQRSTASGDGFNMALSQNALAEAYRLQGNNTAALAAWRLAYRSSLQSSSLDNAVRATGGMADIHRQLGSVDSAYHYYNLYHTHKDSLAEDLSHRRLSAMQARMNFDELQNSLNKAQARLVEMNLMRDRTLLAIGVTGILALWWYNRRRVKQKHVLQLMARKQEEAEREMHKARELAASIASQIVEKNRLADTLKQRITAQVKEVDQEVLTQCLGEYTLFSDRDWERFKSDFAQAYPNFLNVLRQQAEQVTPAEERLAILLFLRLDTEQIANTLGISKDSVLRSKRRLKNRLNLPEQTTVEEYLFKVLV